VIANHKIVIAIRSKTARRVDETPEKEAE